ncbi:MAG: SAM-dependent methyltransferase [Cytophagales bacterium]|nr:SAM-dependent methyltransferase [Cytophagales bacterium]MDW8383903.1 SAM-dependent methyltransferase [Flammeovirgaceae bacterium]
MKVYLIPVPISEEVSFSWQYPFWEKVIEEIQFFFVENERTARRIVSAIKKGIPVQERLFFRLNKNTTLPEIEECFTKIPPESSVGVMSEAGCPGIADPGALLVGYAHQKKWEIIPLVGASSIFLALMSSGLNGQSFVFRGYLPIEKKSRQAALYEMAQAAIKYHQTQIFIETPYRNQELLKELTHILPKSLRLCVACDLTGKTQYIRTAFISEWHQTQLPDINKKPTIFLIGE